MQQHTPGPWIVEDDERSTTGTLIGIYLSQNRKGRIGQVFGNCLVATEEELRANAVLAAAAPDLLEALLNFYDATKFNYSARRSNKGCSAFLKARSLLEKLGYNV